MTVTPTGSSVLENTKGSVAQLGTMPPKAELDKQFSLADVDPIGRTEALIYGPPKSGKTVMASTFPAPFRWVAADGATCIKSLWWAMKTGLSTIRDPKTDVVAYVPQEDFARGLYPDTAKAFNRMTDMIDFWFSPGEVDRWQTLVLDTATEVNEWAMNMGLDLNSQMPTAAKPLSGSHTINKKAKLRIISGQQDYKSAMALFESFITDVRMQCARHGKNLVLLCHVWLETEEDKERGIKRIVSYDPLLLGNLRQRFAKAFDDVWYMEVYNGKEYKLLLHPDPTHNVGTRWGQVLDRTEPADYQKLIAKVRKYYGL